MTRWFQTAVYIGFSMSFVIPSHAAQISFVDQANNAAYTQTGAAQPAAGSALFFFAGQINMQNPGDFSAGNVATPNGQPTNGTNNGLNPDMTLLTSTVFQYESPILSASAYNTEFPNGIYTYTATDTPNQVVTVNQTGTAYATSIPYLTDFTGLQGLNPATPFTVTWDSFTGALGGTCAGSATTCSFVFFDIFRNSDASLVFGADFQSSSSTSVTIPANTLSPLTSYSFQLIFSNRQIGSYSSGTAAFAPEFLSDVRTLGDFRTGAATAVPEPSSITLALIGLAVVLPFGRKKLRR